jgi:integrase
MARLFRQPYTKPIPPGAEPCTHKGKPAVRFTDDGRAITALLTRKGDRIRLLSAKWYGEYVDADGITRREPLSGDKTAAQQMLARLVHKAEMGNAGSRDPFEGQRLRPLLCPPPRSPGDPLACPTRLNAEADIRKQRRDLAIDEAVRLLDATRRSRQEHRGLSGEDRYFLYAVAFQSGLRAGELASLTPASFVLDLDPPFIRVHAKRSKRRKRDEQPIPRELAEALRLCWAGKPADQPVWPGTWRERACLMIGKDLAAARQAWVAEAGTDAEERQRRERSDYLAYEDAEGRALDFHATRHSFITLLVLSGVHPKTAQDLARHSTIDLTMNHYTHLRLHDHAAALEALPSLLPRRAERGSAGAGRDGDGRAPGRARLTIRLPSGLPEG